MKTFIFLFALFSQSVLHCGEHRFVIFIPSYNNEAYCRQNLRSALSQKYEPFRIIYVNDCSTDRTLEYVLDEIERDGRKDLVTVINNTERKRMMRNYYETIHNHIEDDEIVVNLDGDDQLSDPEVLSFLDRVYSEKNPKVWLTYGQSREMRMKRIGQARPYPEEVFQDHSFRRTRIIPSHLRTFYAWLFKQIDVDDLKYEGEFFPMAGDIAMMLPMIEMASRHIRYIPKVLYLYNDRNRLNIRHQSPRKQIDLGKITFARPPYEPLEEEL